MKFIKKKINNIKEVILGLRLIQSTVYFGAIILLCFCAAVNAAAQEQEVVSLKKMETYNGFYRAYFSPDNKMLALMNRTQINVVKIAGGQKACKIAAPPDVGGDGAEFIAAAFSPDNKTLAITYDSGTTGSRNLNIDLYDFSSCEKIKSLAKVHYEHNTGNSLEFAANGRFLNFVVDVSRVWNVESGEEVFKGTLARDYIGYNSALSPDGKWVAAYDEAFIAPLTYGAVSVTNTATKEKLELSKDERVYFRFSDDSTLLYATQTIVDKSSAGIGTRTKVYEVGSWKVIQTIDSTDINNASDVSPNKQLLARGGEGTFKIFSLKTGKMLVEQSHFKRSFADDLAGRMGMISFLAHLEFSPDSTMLASGGEDGTVKLWKIIRK